VDIKTNENQHHSTGHVNMGFGRGVVEWKQIRKNPTYLAEERIFQQ